MGRLSGDVEARAESAERAGDHHGMHDALVDIDTDEPGGINVLADSAQFKALARPVEQVADH